MKSIAVLSIPFVLLICVYGEYELMFTTLSNTFKALGFVALSALAILYVASITQRYLADRPGRNHAPRRRVKIHSI